MSCYEMNGNGKVQPADLTCAVPLNVFEGRNVVICGMCRNNLRDVCFEQCQPAHDYHKLDPLPKEEVRMPRVRFRDTLSWPAIEKWAFTYLTMFYLKGD